MALPSESNIPFHAAKSTRRREPASIDLDEASHTSSCAITPFMPPCSRIYRCRNRWLNKASIPAVISPRRAIASQGQPRRPLSTQHPLADRLPEPELDQAKSRGSSPLGARYPDRIRASPYTCTEKVFVSSPADPPQHRACAAPVPGADFRRCDAFARTDRRLSGETMGHALRCRNRHHDK